MRERDAEKKLTYWIKSFGGMSYKWVSPGNGGVPDRIIILPGGRIYFVELKSDDGNVSPAQQIQIERIRKRGGDVRILRGMDGVDLFLKEVMPE